MCSGACASNGTCSEQRTVTLSCGLIDVCVCLKKGGGGFVVH